MSKVKEIDSNIKEETISNKQMTGYASIDKPWLENYPKELFALREKAKKYNKVLHKIKDVWSNTEECIINYYDTEIKAVDFFDRIDGVAKSLIALGVKEGDVIITSLEAVPEFIELLLASEIVGCSLSNYIGEIKDIIKLINAEENVKYYIAPDYLSSKDANEIYASTKINNIITIEPLFSAKDKNKVRSNIIEVINSKYLEEKTNDTRNISWCDFLNKGNSIDEYKENNKSNIRLFTAFTSGSTGNPKGVIHSSESILGIVEQMALFPSHEKNKDTWLLTILPPTLVAVVVAMMCYPLVDGKELILDPYCKIEDVDIEMMHYKPSGWALIPIFFNTLLESDRIPKEYDMSYFKLFGFGAEPMTKKFISEVENFKESHNCTAPFSSGYGQSEGGSDFTVAMGKEMLLSGSAGIPLIDTTISIFEPNTTNELKYNEIGEICKSGSGIMLGYTDKELTDKVLKKHTDGKLWLHTGDYGYMTEKGLLFVLGREEINVYSGKKVFPLNIENKITSVEGVKEAIIVSGKDKINEGFKVPHLFIVPENNVENDTVLTNVTSFLDKELLQEEKPVDIHFIDQKPIRKFKTDKIGLQIKYNL